MHTEVSVGKDNATGLRDQKEIEAKAPFDAEENARENILKRGKGGFNFVSP